MKFMGLSYKLVPGSVSVGKKKVVGSSRSKIFLKKKKE